MSSLTPEDTQAITRWRTQNDRMLRERYPYHYLACGKDELLAAGTNLKSVEEAAQATGKPYILDWIPARVGDVCFWWVKFYGIKNNEPWNPLYPVKIAHNDRHQNVYMVVDSGSEVSLIDRELGYLLGLTLLPEEVLQTGEGVGGEIQYVNRSLNFTIDGRAFKAPVAWLISDVAAPLLLGREVVFDLFDIKFVQAEKRIEFEWRGEGDADETAT
jgi:Aspartyl protease